jgi:site-specific DNA-methyltransferase (adenine-specific)
MEQFENIKLYNADCMDVMRTFKDKQFDLAIVDPPYGIDINNQSQGKGGGVSRKIDYTKKDWDKTAPEIIYFNELRRVSKNQIIWGANHFISRCRLIVAVGLYGIKITAKLILLIANSHGQVLRLR